MEYWGKVQFLEGQLMVDKPIVLRLLSEEKVRIVENDYFYILNYIKIVEPNGKESLGKHTSETIHCFDANQDSIQYDCVFYQPRSGPELNFVIISSRLRPMHQMAIRKKTQLVASKTSRCDCMEDGIKTENVELPYRELYVIPIPNDTENCAQLTWCCAEVLPNGTKVFLMKENKIPCSFL